METFKRIVLFIPHSSDNLDRSEWTGDIDAAIDRWTDWHTDKLFRSDDDRVKSVVFPYSRFYCDAERLIEQFMLTANEAVATLLTEKGIPCVYRVHESPSPEKLESFVGYLKHIGESDTEDDWSELFITCVADECVSMWSGMNKARREFFNIASEPSSSFSPTA